MALACLFTMTPRRGQSQALAPTAITWSGARARRLARGGAGVVGLTGSLGIPGSRVGRYLDIQLELGQIFKLRQIGWGEGVGVESQRHVDHSLEQTGFGGAPALNAGQSLHRVPVRASVGGALTLSLRIRQNHVRHGGSLSPSTRADRPPRGWLRDDGMDGGSVAEGSVHEFANELAECG